jgi:uncharacterized membrane protein YjjP (DUF1212 family)
MTQPARFTAETDARIAFILGLASALHEAGHATNRLEAGLSATAERLGLTSQFFATPTSIFASFGEGPKQQTFMLRTEPTAPDLGQLVRVTEIAQGVLAGGLTPAEGTLRLAALAERPRPSAVATLIAYGLASAAAARFLGGGVKESAVALGAGLTIGLLAVAARRFGQLARIFELVAAFVAAFGVAAAGAAWGGFSASLATLAGLIVLIPGLTLTTGIAELAHRHLTAGTSRLAGAFMTFIGIGFGVALGSRLGAAAFGPAAAASPAPLAAWINWLALLASALAFAILLRADRRDFVWIVLAGALAFGSTRLGSALLGSELGVFIGALLLGLGGNAFNRLTARPSAVTMVPGLLILVPGSIGFRSVTALLESQVVTGIETAVSMVLTATSLVAGLLVAAAIYPERPIA